MILRYQRRRRRTNDQLALTTARDRVQQRAGFVDRVVLRRVVAATRVLRLRGGEPVDDLGDLARRDVRERRRRDSRRAELLQRAHRHRRTDGLAGRRVDLDRLDLPAQDVERRRERVVHEHVVLEPQRLRLWQRDARDGDVALERGDHSRARRLSEDEGRPERGDSENGGGGTTESRHALPRALRAYW